MARPYKHPKTGVYWLRRAAPHALRQAVGKREELQSLGTKDATEAKQRFATTLAEVEAKWANLRAGHRSLTEREANEIAASFHDVWLNAFRDDPGDQVLWWPAHDKELWTRRRVHDLLSKERGNTVAIENGLVRGMRNWRRACGT